MSESASLPMNFGGIDEEQYSLFDAARVLILPVSYEGTVSYGTGTGAGAVNFTVQANPGAARTGTITVQGQVVTVSQAGM